MIKLRKHNNMIFEFQENYNQLSVTCPPSNYISKNIDPVFRWTFDSINDSRNFTSQYHKKPKRFQSKSDLEKCSALGLSMYHSVAGARTRFTELLNSIGSDVYKTIGNHIAQGKILPQDGVNGPKEYSDHFNHHPCKGYDYSASFHIKEKL